MPMSPLQHNSASAVASVQEFSSEERSQLLRLAHDSISSALDHLEISTEPPTPHFAELRGVFTSIYLRHDTPEHDQPGHDRPAEALRGCVGYVLPTCPVYRAVAETARAAAFADNRFSPVTREEAPHLAIELSILSPAQPILPRSARQLARTPRPAVAASPGRARVGPHNVPGTNLPQSWIAPRYVAKRRGYRGVHGGSLRREECPLTTAAKQKPETVARPRCL
jgi:hypothetical protein